MERRKMISKKFVFRAMLFSFLMVFAILGFGAASSDISASKDAPAEIKTFPTTFLAAEDFILEEFGVKVSAECNYLSGREKLPVYCLDPKGKSSTGNIESRYYTLVKFSDPKDHWGKDIATIRVSRQIIKAECQKEIESPCNNRAFFSLGWFVDYWSSD